MKAKFLTSLLVSILGVNVHAISYDFNMGFALGWNYDLRHSPPDTVIMPRAQLVGSQDSLKAKNISQFTSLSFGGFLGGGISFPSTFTSSIGLEYTGKYFANSQRYKYETQSNTRVIRLDITETQMGVFDNFVDLYYKVTLMKKIPMDLQLNLGLASRLLIGTTVARDDAFGYYPTQLNLKAQSGIPPLGLGVHFAMRYNIHMFFLALDYSYIPAYHYSADTADALRSINGDGENVSKLVSTWSTNLGWDSAHKRGFNDHSFSISLGMIFNKAILDSFMSL